jgi:hypothetical protein
MVVSPTFKNISVLVSISLMVGSTNLKSIAHGSSHQCWDIFTMNLQPSHKHFFYQESTLEKYYYY